MEKYPLYSHPRILNFAQLIDRNADNWPNDTAFRYRDKKEILSVSYSQFKDDICKLASYFKDEKLNGEFIAMIGENHYFWIVTYFAVVLSGNIIVPIDKELPSGDIAELLSRCGAKMLVYADSYADIASEMLEMGRIEAAFNMENISSLLKNKNGIGDSSWHDINEDRVCAIIFTSGTTGKPKGVMLSQKNLMADTVSACQNVWIAGATLLTLPLHHTFAFTTSVLAMLYYHVPICINRSLRTFMEDLQIFKPQNMFLVPLYVETIYKNIWKTAREQKKESALKMMVSISSIFQKFRIDIRREIFSPILQQFGGELDLLISGGAPLKQAYIDGLEAFGIQVLNGYGITECAPVVAVNRNKYFKNGSIGLPLSCCEIKILDGEICVKGENVMLGYYQDNATTDNAMQDGWFKTGDMGYIDAEGFLFITGRKKNLIILSNGKNVASEELEEKLLDIDHVQEAIVYAKNDFIEAEIFADQTEQEGGIRESIMELNKRLPGYKRIQKVVFRSSEFEKTTTKKIKR